MKVFVLGNKGLLGSAVESFFRGKGAQVKGVNRDNYDSLKGSECDVFINCNGNSKKYLADRDPAGDFEMNVAATLRSVEDFKFGKYVHMSTVDVYNDYVDPGKNREDAPIDPLKLSNYGFSKFVGEQVVRKHARCWIILRLGGLIGPGLSKGPIYDLLRERTLWVNPESELQFVDTRVVAGAAFELLGRGIENDTFNVCGTGAVKLSSLAEQFKIDLSPELREKEIQRRNVSNSKISRLVKIPPTLEAVRKFAQEWPKA